MEQTEEQNKELMEGFTPKPATIYLHKQPALTLFCRPKIIPLKSDNLKLLEHLERQAEAPPV